MVERLGQLGTGGALSIVDQGTYSLANFAVGVLLARWLAPDEYGAFALAFAGMLVFYQLHLSLVVDPMGVLGPSYYLGDLSAYLISQVRLHFAFMLPLGISFGSLLLLVSSHSAKPFALISWNLGVMSLCLPFLLLPGLLRRAFYVLGRPEIAIFGSLAYAASLLIALLLIRALGQLSSISAIASMGLAGLCCGLVLLWYLYRLGGNGSRPSFRRVLILNWTYARWLVASSVFMALAGQAQVFIAGRMLGVESAGVIRAMQTLTQPMVLSIGAVTAMGTPSLALDFSQGKLRSLHHKVTFITISLLIVSVLFEIFVAIFAHPLEQLFYGGRFASHSLLISLWGMTTIFLSVYWGGAIALQAANRPQAVLIVSLIWLPLVFTLGALFTSWWGIWGTSLSAVVGYAAIALICWGLYWVWIPRDEEHHAV